MAEIEARSGQSELVALDGVVEHIIYHNEENGYTVCELSSADLAGDPKQDHLITAVGTLPYIAPGEMIRAMGSFLVHPSFGKQFKIEYYEKQLPATSESILKYLSSGVLHGIGPKTAQRIVGMFGVDTFDVIEKEPEKLAELPGISYQKAMDISEEFQKQFGMRNVMMFCRDYFGPATSVRIYKKWGVAAVDIIRQNPYRLCDEFYGIGFERADRVAKSLGIESYREQRMQAAIKFILSENGIRNGHVYLPKDRLLEGVCQMLRAEKEEAVSALKTLIQNDAVKCAKIGSRTAVYLKPYFDAELWIVKKLFLLEKTCEQIEVRDAERIVSQIEAEESITYAKMQRKAILSAINHGVMLLTGGPGTGKTTIIRAVVRIFERLGLKYVLAAPTGRAAKRMSEATQQEAKTIHRLLEMSYSDGEYPKFQRDENNLLEEKVVIVDESSMIDTLLLCALLKAMKPGSRLILIGDSDQLPSVGAGNVLHDLLESDCFSSVRLKEIFRQASESLIITNAHAINAGEYPTLTAKDNDFFFVPRQSEEEIALTVADLCLNRLPKTYGEQMRQQIQVIAPSRKGGAGTIALNALLQKYLNPASPNKREKKHGETIFREGDKVMQIRNNYDLQWKRNGSDGCGVFNGDIGRILEILPAQESMKIEFDDRVAEYDFSMLDELEHAYAITVHKSQGSEYPIVVMPVYPFTDRLLTRNLLYTAVTRAQRMVVLVGQASVVGSMVQNYRQTKRYTGLCPFLQKMMDEAG